MIWCKDLKQCGEGLSNNKLEANSVVEAWASLVFRASWRAIRDAILTLPSREKILELGGIRRIFVPSRNSFDEELYHLANLVLISWALSLGPSRWKALMGCTRLAGSGFWYPTVVRICFHLTPMCSWVAWLNRSVKQSESWNRVEYRNHPISTGDSWSVALVKIEISWFQRLDSVRSSTSQKGLFWARMTLAYTLPVVWLRWLRVLSREKYHFMSE